MIATAVVQIKETDKVSCKHFETLSVSLDVEELRKREQTDLLPGEEALLPQVTGFCVTCTGTLLFTLVASNMSFSAKSVHLFGIEKTDVTIRNESFSSVIIYKTVLM